MHERTTDGSTDLSITSVQKLTIKEIRQKMGEEVERGDGERDEEANMIAGEEMCDATKEKEGFAMMVDLGIMGSLTSLIS
ncbi:hypothetical protein QVD17_40126 [Tagetes erecta]|uniref:Uncharacterized protein n=1 Tax=Tagetes erecta TaxID=13708 RepID=A0AAD8NFZ6_TARER|nr:hypothetical protein QVD17_40126 [Tagetes erecta]